MSGRHLGKAAHASRSLLSRMRDRIKHGVQAPPLWYETVRRSPPMTIPDKSKAELKKIVLPTDRLAQEYLHRNPDVAFEGVPMDGEPSTTPLLFAQRQWELMKGGVPEAQAYRQVEGELAREKERAFEHLRELTRAATETMGARPALFADGDTIRQYSEWQERLDELPYVEWDFGEQVALDHWLVESLLAWTWRHEKLIVEREFDAELSRLRRALFPQIPPSEEEELEDGAAYEEARTARAAADDAARGRALFGDRFGDDEEALRAAANAAWVEKFDALQLRVETKAYAEWSATEKDELDLWLLDNYAAIAPTPKSTTGIDPASAGRVSDDDDRLVEQLVEAKYAMFPELKPQSVAEAAAAATAAELAAAEASAAAHPDSLTAAHRARTLADAAAEATKKEALHLAVKAAKTKAETVEAIRRHAPETMFLPSEKLNSVKAIREHFEQATGRKVEELQAGFTNEYNTAKLAVIHETQRKEEWLTRVGALEAHLTKQDAAALDAPVEPPIWRPPGAPRLSSTSSSIGISADAVPYESDADATAAATAAASDETERKS